MTAQAVDVHVAQRLLEEGAILIDVREPDEHARERIASARLVPLSRLSTRFPSPSLSWVSPRRTSPSVPAPSRGIVGVTLGKTLSARKHPLNLTFADLVIVVALFVNARSALTPTAA